MKIDNGERQPLVIPEVFNGVCGVSRGRVAFSPVVPWQAPPAARAMLSGRLTLLTDIAPAEDGRSYTARYQVLG